MAKGLGPGTTFGAQGHFTLYQWGNRMTRSENVRAPCWPGDAEVIWYKSRYMDRLAAEAEIQKLRDNGDHVGAAEILLAIETMTSF